jgi:hypothetical protein
MKLLLQRSRSERMAAANKLQEQFFMLHVFFNLGNKNDSVEFSPNYGTPHAIVLFAQCHELPVTHTVCLT